MPHSRARSSFHPSLLRSLSRIGCSSLIALGLSHGVTAQDYRVSAGKAYQGPIYVVDWTPGIAAASGTHYRRRSFVRSYATGMSVDLWAEGWGDGTGTDQGFHVEGGIRLKGVVFSSASSGNVTIYVNTRVTGAHRKWSYLPHSSTVLKVTLHGNGRWYGRTIPTPTPQNVRAAAEFYLNSKYDVTIDWGLEVGITGTGAMESWATATLPRNADVFSVPAGVTVNSADGQIVNNRFVGKSPSKRPVMSHSPLAIVSGKNVTFQTSGCTPGDTVMWYFGGGLAKAPICFPGGWCVGLAQPWIYWTRTKADASGVAAIGGTVPASLQGTIHLQSFALDTGKATIHSSNVDQASFQ